MITHAQSSASSSASSSPKVAVITGGSRGIGRATVNLFKESGWMVATCAQKLTSLKDSRADLNFECDVADAKQVKQALENIIRRFGKIDALINNAGLAGSNPLDPQSSDEMWHRIVDVNLHGTYYFSKYAAPHISEKTGHIINISSVLGLKGVPDQTAYCAAKHAVVGFTRSFAHELAPRGITVNAVCPGWVDTDMATGRIREIGMTLEQTEKSVPLGRLIKPEEIADFIYYLCSSSSSRMITGQTLTIDGGSLA